jgi:DNA-binding response OmpR family regulator
MSDASGPVVLVVEDDLSVAQTYEHWLADDYDVRIAESGLEALAAIDHSVDVVLLDRMMPGMSGDQILAEFEELAFEPMVAMTTGVTPDIDIVELGFDDYVTKPAERDELVATVEELLQRADRPDVVQRYLSLTTKREALESLKSTVELENCAAYANLLDEIAAVDVDPDEVPAGSSAETERARSARSDIEVAEQGRDDVGPGSADGG